MDLEVIEHRHDISAVCHGVGAVCCRATAWLCGLCASGVGRMDG